MPTCQVHPLPYEPDPSRLLGRLQGAPGVALLDSGRPQAERGRYDLLSAWPLETLRPGEDESGTAFFDRLRGALARLGPAELPEGLDLPFAGGLIGMLGYDFGRRLERLPVLAHDDLSLPEAQVGLYAWAWVTDHRAARSQLVFHPRLESAERQRLIALFSEAEVEFDAEEPFRLPRPFTGDLAFADYQAAFERIQAYIHAGDCYQVNFAQRWRAGYAGSLVQAYRRLRQACPTPFSGFLGSEDGAVLSLSPERFMRVSGRQVETRPIKGTRPRGGDAAEDATNAQELQDSPKDRAENLMIVDLLRNDLGRSCAIGSVRVPQLFALESYPNVHHLVSSVTGTLASDRDPLDLLAGSFPGGSITGAPKIRAMQIIEELEPTRRAIYCGSLFYLDVRGEMDSSIAIRTLLASRGTLACWGGGGIVADSDCRAEYQESIGKVSVLMRALEGL
ncbi:aminodeoxychorismate synthase component I [Stutzerimonas azotifigens]|uniref:aminodeoxychorismate synthase component I n=1 Tax=Stutzerimonas azotifigens TaxID=291995 RepID=UPI000401371A|nr:aminodeoxychorismate synthase component I [Stutzerimonas azotifigens]